MFYANEKPVKERTLVIYLIQFERKIRKSIFYTLIQKAYQFFLKNNSICEYMYFKLIGLVDGFYKNVADV